MRSIIKDKTSVVESEAWMRKTTSDSITDDKQNDDENLLLNI